MLPEFRIERIPAGDPLAEAAVDLVLDGQVRTGLPPVDLWPAARLAARTRERQARAAGIWVATVDGGRPGERTVVGHALLEPVPAGHPDFSRVPEAQVRLALAAGRLLELGGLVVAAGWLRRGIATALLEARLEAAGGAVVVSSVWRESAGSQALAHRYAARLVGARTAGPYDLFLYGGPQRHAPR